MVRPGPMLHRLPLELLLQIWDYLDIQDVFAFRLVCRHLERLLFDTFCQEFYSDRRFSITHHSLAVLTKISEDQRLRGWLTSLTIGLDRLDSSDPLPRVLDDSDNANQPVRGMPRLREDIKPHILETLSLEQDFIMNSGLLQLMLTDILENLPNLEELAVRDQNARRKVPRAGANPLLVSYGSSHVRQATGIDFTGPDPESHLGRHDDRFVDNVFSSLLLALVRSHTRIASLTVDIQKGNVGLSKPAFIIPDFLSRRIHPTLSSLRTLSLSVSWKRTNLGSYSSSYDGFLPWEEHQVFNFLRQTPNLVTLRIQAKQQGYFADGLISWLLAYLNNSEADERSVVDRPAISESTTKPHLSGALAVPHRFQTLRELELGNMRARSRTLSRIFRHLSKTLRQLRLSRIALEILKADAELDNDAQKPNAWSMLFQDMYDLVELQRFTVAGLEHHTPSCSQNNGHTVAFLPSDFGIQSGPRNGLLHTWSHNGNTDAIRRFLRVLARNTVIICRRCRERNSGYQFVDDILELQGPGDAIIE